MKKYIFSIFLITLPGMLGSCSSHGEERETGHPGVVLLTSSKIYWQEASAETQFGFVFETLFSGKEGGGDNGIAAPRKTISRIDYKITQAAADSISLDRQEIGASEAIEMELERSRVLITSQVGEYSGHCKLKSDPLYGSWYSGTTGQSASLVCDDRLIIFRPSKSPVECKGYPFKGVEEELLWQLDQAEYDQESGRVLLLDGAQYADKAYEVDCNSGQLSRFSPTAGLSGLPEGHFEQLYNVCYSRAYGWVFEFKYRAGQKNEDGYSIEYKTVVFPKIKKSISRKRDFYREKTSFLNCHNNTSGYIYAAAEDMRGKDIEIHLYDFRAGLDQKNIDANDQVWKLKVDEKPDAEGRPKVTVNNIKN